MRTVEILQLKGKIDEKAEELCVPPQMLLRNYLLERLLERISVSPWQEKIVFKGDMLVGTLLGTRRRSNNNGDGLVRGFNLSAEDAESIFTSLAATDLGDGVSFAVLRVQQMRDAAEYPGVRVFLRAAYGPLSMPFSVDVTAADAVALDALAFGYPLSFEDRYISLLTYPPAACLAEKLETVIGQSDSHARMRDYYDIFALWRARREEFAPRQISRALHAVAECHGTLELMAAYRSQMSAVRESETMQQQWDAYRAHCEFVRDVSLEDLCDLVCEIMEATDWVSYAVI